MYTRELFIEESNRISQMTSSQLNNLIKSIQWYSTFVLATIAGVTKLILDAHGFAYACLCIALIVAALTLGLFIYCVVEAQGLIFSQEKTFASALSLIENEDFERADAKTLFDFKRQLYKSLDILEDSYLEQAVKLGLWAFAGSVLIGGLGVIFHTAA